MNTKRLTLMPLHADQVRALASYAGTDAAHCGDEILDTAISSELLAAVTAAKESSAQADWYSLWLLIDTRENQAIGFAGFQDGPDEAGFVQIFCWLSGRWQENGYASEAIRALCFWAFEQAGCAGVLAKPKEEDSYLHDELHSCGFETDAQRDNVPCWSLIRHASFVCPVCRGALARTRTGLSCKRRHTFDRARQGYVNLLRKKPDTLYEDKALFTARRYAFWAGFFDPLIDTVRPYLPTAGTVIDAGCGEGSLLSRLCGPSLRGVGLDISREAIKMAASANKAVDWCVGDLCDIPLEDHAVDAVINMLTPANYGEFVRVLKVGGRLIKIVPNEGHLREVRIASGIRETASVLSETESALARRFTSIESRRIHYSITCDESLARAVFEMTPMTWHVRERETSAGCITVDVMLLVGVLS